MRILRANVDDHDAVIAACQTITRLTAGGEQTDKAAAIVKTKRDAIAAAGGIEAVVRVLREHQANAAVMQEACRALVNLACLDANQARIAAAGGIEAVVRVMGEHQANAAVMRQACWALCFIGWSDEALQKRIKDAGSKPLWPRLAPRTKPRREGRGCWTSWARCESAGRDRAGLRWRHALASCLQNYK